MGYNDQTWSKNDQKWASNLQQKVKGSRIISHIFHRCLGLPTMLDMIPEPTPVNAPVALVVGFSAAAPAHKT